MSMSKKLRESIEESMYLKKLRSAPETPPSRPDRMNLVHILGNGNLKVVNEYQNLVCTCGNDFYVTESLEYIRRLHRKGICCPACGQWRAYFESDRLNAESPLRASPNEREMIATPPPMFSNPPKTVNVAKRKKPNPRKRPKWPIARKNNEPIQAA